MMDIPPLTVFNMAPVDQQKLIQTLNELSIDCEQFDDLSFDGICHELSLQPFLQWFCGGFDANNVLKEEQVSDYHFLQKNNAFGNDYNLDEEKGIAGNSGVNHRERIKVLEKTLEIARENLTLCNSEEEKLLQKEKETYSKLHATKTDFLDFCSKNKKEDLFETAEKTLKICLGVSPAIPDFEITHRFQEQNNVDLNSFTCSFVTPVEELLENDGKEMGERTIEVKDALVDSFAKLALSERRLRNEELLTDNIQRDIERRVENLLIGRERMRLQRCLNAHNYAISSLKLKKDIIIHLYSELFLRQAHLKELKNKFDLTFALIKEFISIISQKTDEMKSIVTGIKKKNNEQCLKNGLHSESDDSESDDVISTCKLFLSRSSDQQSSFSHELRSKIDSCLSRLQCGPTKNITLISPEINYLLNDCRMQREKRHSDTKALSLRLLNSTNSFREPDNLLWMEFLTGQDKFRSNFSSVSPHSVNETFLGFSQSSSTSFFHK